MTTQPLQTLSLLQELDEPEFALDPQPVCRFCGCSEEKPCSILIREGDGDRFHLALSVCEMTMALPCTSYIPGVCSSPYCIEKLLVEMRSGAREVRAS